MKIRYLLMLSIIALMCSQCKMRKTFVEDSEIAWVECYSPGDTLLFESGFDSVRLVVDVVDVCNPDNDNPYDWEGRSFLSYFEFSDAITGFCEVKLDLIDNVQGNGQPQVINEWASLSVSSTDIYGISFIVGKIYILDRHGKLGIYRQIRQGNMAGQDFIVRASDHMSNEEIEQKKKYHSEDPVTDFEWSRERGLISFTFNDTTVYRLEKHIHKTEVI